MSDADDLQKIITSKHRRLQKLKEQEAIYGISTPPEVLIQIEDLEEELAQLQAQLQSLPATPSVSSTLAQPGSKYNINISGLVSGLTIGDESQVTQNFGATSPPVPNEALARLEARLDEIAVQLAKDVDDLKKGQNAIYHRIKPGQQAQVAQILTAIQAGNIAQTEMQATLNDLHRAMRIALNRGLPMDAELRAAIIDLTEAVESSLSLDQKLELALPLLPLLLNYKIELGAGSDLDLHALWDELQARWRGLLERTRGDS